MDFNLSPFQIKAQSLRLFSMGKNDYLRYIHDNEKNIIEFYLDECLELITNFLIRSKRNAPSE